MLTSQKVIEDLHFLSDRLSGQVRAVCAALLAVSWGLIITPATVPRINRAGLLLVSCLAIVSLAIDILQYVAGYNNALRYLHRLERGEEIPGYSPADRAYKLRARTFTIKAYVTVGAFLLFLTLIVLGLLP